MIGLRHLSHNRTELYASHFPLEALKPYLLEYYRDAYATVVLYEDNPEFYHETGIVMFQAGEPETFNYEEFQAPLIEEFNDKLAICTVENLFQHFDNLSQSRPKDDDPFYNLVFSISLSPPSREILLDWEQNIENRLETVLYDTKAEGHFLLFPYEDGVVYSHGNHYTSITSDKPELIRAVFEDMVEKQLAALTQQPINQSLLNTLYQQLLTHGALRLSPDRVHPDKDGTLFLLVTYPGQKLQGEKRIAKLGLSAQGEPVSLSEPELMPRWRYHLYFNDWSMLPFILLVILMAIGIVGWFYFKSQLSL